MADVGQRVVRDLRNALFRHVLGQSAGFFAQRTSGKLNSRINNDVAAGAAGSLGDRRGSGPRIALARRLCRDPLLLRRVAHGLLPDQRAAGRVSAGAARAAGPPDDQAQPGSHRAALAHQHRGADRPPHRQGVRHGGQGGRQVRAGGRASVSHEHEGHGRARGPPAADGAARRLRDGRRVCGTAAARSPPGISPWGSSRRSWRRCC